MEKGYCENLKKNIYPRGVVIDGNALRVTEFVGAIGEAQKAFDTLNKIYEHIYYNEDNLKTKLGIDILNIISNDFLG